MTPVHSAAQTAGAELSTGNYSFSNSSMGQLNYANQSSFQQTTAPSLSSGFFTDNYGIHQIKHGQKLLTVNQDPSSLNTSISTVEAYTNSLQEAKQNAQTRVDTTQESYIASKSVAERSSADLIEHLSSGQTYSTGESSGVTNTVQSSANFIKNVASSWGEQHGISSRDSVEYFSSLGIGCPIGVDAKLGNSGSCSALSDDAVQSAKNIVLSKDFQEHYQNVLNSSSSESLSSLTDAGKRFSESYAASMDHLKSSQDQFNEAYSNLNQISENLSYVQSHSSNINTNLNTEFSNWLDQKGCLGYLFDKDKECHLNTLRDEFIDEKCQSTLGQMKQFSYPSAPTPAQDGDIEHRWDVVKNRSMERAETANLSKGQIPTQLSFNQQQATTVSTKLDLQKEIISKEGLEQIDLFDNERSRSNYSRLNERLSENCQGLKESLEKASCGWFNIYKE